MEERAIGTFFKTKLPKYDLQRICPSRTRFHERWATRDTRSAGNTIEFRFGLATCAGEETCAVLPESSRHTRYV